MFITPDHHKKGPKPKDFRDRDLVFVDLEMTGSDPDVHEIIEIGWVVAKARTFKKVSEYEAKVKPVHIKTAEAEGLRVAGYSEKEWTKAKDLEVVLKKFAKCAPNALLVGSAVYHDWEFLERGFSKYNIMPTFNFHLLPLDTMAYIKLYDDKRVKSTSLRSGLSDYYGINYPAQHGALVDAKLSYEVFLKLMGR